MNPKRLIRITYFTMLTVIGGLIKFYVPYSEIVFTFQTLFVISAGLFLGARDGALSQIAYLILGLAGVPVFANGGGVFYVSQPTFGYLIAFPLGAFTTGRLKAGLKTLSVAKLFICAVIGLGAVYFVGTIYQVLIFWLYFDRDFLAAVSSLACLPVMFAADCILLYIICLIYPRLMTMIGANKKIAA